ncbi:MAG TPA: hypothetical protein VFR81_24940 [Longimicrobium sp.]|nr:hypothetical protein [Longimicrobium sp.]
MEPTFETPELAAMAGFPAMYCRVAASYRDGDEAYVVVDTGSGGHPYLYGVSVARQDGGWVEGTSGNGPGWTLTDRDRGLGTAHLWGEAPAGADRVRVTFRGETREAPVARGVYLVAWCRVPDGDDSPRVDAFHVGGRWVTGRPAF